MLPDDDDDDDDDDEAHGTEKYRRNKINLCNKCTLCI
jgi:hypothetical protein